MIDWINILSRFLSGFLGALILLLLVSPLFAWYKRIIDRTKKQALDLLTKAEGELEVLGKVSQPLRAQSAFLTAILHNAEIAAVIDKQIETGADPNLSNAKKDLQKEAHDLNISGRIEFLNEYLKNSEIILKSSK